MPRVWNGPAASRFRKETQLAASKRNKKTKFWKKSRRKPFGKFSQEYLDYLNSEKWADTRQRAFAFHGKRCLACGTTEHLQVHHMNYKRLGNELMDDLRVLCEECHDKYHRAMRKRQA